MSAWLIFAFCVGLTVGACMGLLTAALLLANDGAERMDRP